MLDAFASVGVRAFDVTLTDIKGDKIPRGFQANRGVDQLRASIGPQLEAGARTVSKMIAAGGIAEGTYAADLAALANAHPDLSIGSYPSVIDGKFHNEIVVRGKDPAAVEAGAAAVAAFLARLRPSRL